MKKLIAGNWKMNGSMEQARNLVAGVSRGVRQMPALMEKCDILVCPPFPYFLEVNEVCQEHSIALGGQDCSTKSSGAYTGEISPNMIKDCGGKYVILGHSERRQYHREDDDYVSAKAAAAHSVGLISIICVGETEAEREAGGAEAVVEKQLLGSVPKGANANNTVIAYEPVWAIGTGKTASAEDVREMHKFIRDKLKECVADYKKIRILYGGSMKPENAAELLGTENVDGGLIGGASLDAEQFLAIALAAPEN